MVPPIITSPEEMERLTEEYFELRKIPESRKWIDKRGNYQDQEVMVPPTIEGLVLHLGFVNRQSLQDYSKNDARYSVIVSRARTKILQAVVSSALLKEIDPGIAKMVAGAIDNDYRDKQIVEHTINPENVAQILRQAATQSAEHMLPADKLNLPTKT